MQPSEASVAAQQSTLVFRTAPFRVGRFTVVKEMYIEPSARASSSSALAEPSLQSDLDHHLECYSSVSSISISSETRPLSGTTEREQEDEEAADLSTSALSAEVAYLQPPELLHFSSCSTVTSPDFHQCRPYRPERKSALLTLPIPPRGNHKDLRCLSRSSSGTSLSTSEW
eukprot:CAMPEP_0206466220 /NCGR_PEP_ID=MMETSP0324_2-20121206/28324_1 /ASSEMBLY_ACC=CAM_ASM_000836 /TAXON_ID=2866 /ORGANISM="Crypthecodinium cohnii, Strain Seligo" /LENGTH=170 /DNA_ID=CAMNT_0053939285 /DNA_START=95 /DNA_END=604 /DNA_ORIENTATION=+